MLRKGQHDQLAKGDVLAPNRVINQLFGFAAERMLAQPPLELQVVFATLSHSVPPVGPVSLMIEGTLPLRCCVFLYRSLVQLQAHARLIRQGQAAMPGDRRLDVDHLIDAFP